MNEPTCESFASFAPARVLCLLEKRRGGNPRRMGLQMGIQWPGIAARSESAPYRLMPRHLPRINPDGPARTSHFTFDLCALGVLCVRKASHTEAV